MVRNGFVGGNVLRCGLHVCIIVLHYSETIRGLSNHTRKKLDLFPIIVSKRERVMACPSL